jgi:hypothetical protein
VLPKWLKEIPEIKTVVDFTKWENVKEEVKEVASTNVKKLKM